MLPHEPVVGSTDASFSFLMRVCVQREKKKKLSRKHLEPKKKKEKKHTNKPTIHRGADDVLYARIEREGKRLLASRCFEKQLAHARKQSQTHARTSCHDTHTRTDLE